MINTLTTERGNKLISNPDGTIIAGVCIGFKCKKCGEEHIASIKGMWEEPYYCNCGTVFNLGISINQTF